MKEARNLQSTAEERLRKLQVELADKEAALAPGRAQVRAARACTGVTLPAWCRLGDVCDTETWGFVQASRVLPPHAHQSPPWVRDSFKLPDLILLSLLSLSHMLTGAPPAPS